MSFTNSSFRLATESPRWGYRRIQGELLKLGHCCSHLTVRNVLRRHGPFPAPRRSYRSWREFIRQQSDQLLAVDFFTMETVYLTLLYVLFFIEIGTSGPSFYFVTGIRSSAQPSTRCSEARA